MVSTSFAAIPSKMHHDTAESLCVMVFNDEIIMVSGRGGGSEEGLNKPPMGPLWCFRVMEVICVGGACDVSWLLVHKVTIVKSIDTGG